MGDLIHKKGDIDKHSFEQDGRPMSARMQKEHRKLDHILQTTGSKLIRNLDADYDTFLKVRYLLIY